MTREPDKEGSGWISQEQEEHAAEPDKLQAQTDEADGKREDAFHDPPNNVHGDSEKQKENPHQKLFYVFHENYLRSKNGDVISIKNARK